MTGDEVDVVLLEILLEVFNSESRRTYELVRDAIAGVLHPDCYATAAAAYR